MFPIRDDIPHPRPAAATWLIIAACAYFFWRELSLSPGALANYVDAFGLVPARDWPPGIGDDGQFTFFPFVTTMFLHGGFGHILSNLWALWIFGRSVETRMGPARFLIFYVACGLAASITHAALNPDSTIPVVGASGAIAGVMGAYAPLFPRARLKMLFLFVFYPVLFEIPALAFLLIWFGAQLLSGAVTLSGADIGSGAEPVAFWAHIGGFIAGVALFKPFCRPKS